MSINYTIIPAKSLVYTRYTGCVTNDQRIDYIHALSRDINYQAPMKNLMDMRQCRKYIVTSEEEKKFAKQKIALSKRFAGELCVICAPADFQYGMSRMHEILMSPAPGIETRIFRTLEESLEWLGLKSPCLESQD